MRVLILVLFILGSFFTMQAHGDLHERIVKATEEISKDSSNPSLYFKRGQLYFQHEDFDNALADFNKAKKLNLPTDEVEYWIARLYLETKNTTKGIETIKLFLANNPTDVNAIRVYAKLAEQATDLATAVIQFKQVIGLTITPLPDNYLELAAVLRQQKDYDGAIEWLLKGSEALGKLYVFDAEMISIYKELNNYPEAIRIYQRLAYSSNRKEVYYFEIGNGFLQMDDKDAASKYYKLSLGAIEMLPPHLQETPAMKELADNVKAANENL